MIEIIFKHWKTEELISVTGTIVHDNPASDRIVVLKSDGTYEDIIRESIESTSRV